MDLFSGKVLLEDVKAKLVTYDVSKIKSLLEKEFESFNKKIIVLDDDPTGIQTIYNKFVYTDWSVESMEEGLCDDNLMFFILTNSRCFSAQETIRVHTEIAINLLEASKRTNKDFLLISRGDSTLRGHYPLETEVLKQTLEANSQWVFHGEIVCPFFKEGGRYTVNNFHYVQEGQYLVPSGETEFAKDITFGYRNSHLGLYIEEKSKGSFNSKDGIYIDLEAIRNFDLDGISEKLLKSTSNQKIIVNALEYSDLEIFMIALLRAISLGKRFLFRTAASFVKVISGMNERGLLERNDLINHNSINGGMIIVGSHVKKTTEQLEELKLCDYIHFIEFNQHLIVSPEKIEEEICRVVILCEKNIAEGKTVAIYTRRERLDLCSHDKEAELAIAVKISESITKIVQRLTIRPSYILAKGGITSSDVGIKGLGVRKAQVAGQIKPGVPVWLTDAESKFPGMPYIIFPGNVGTKDTLKEIVEIMHAK